MKNSIRVRGARVNNLKNIDVDIPLNAITVVTGLSGSGKSSLVFDTVYAEGRRRYIESLSYYARQFLGDFSKPDVDKIEGLCPAVSIDQKIPFRNPRSTLGTITEIYDLLRVLFVKAGRQHCPFCNAPVKKFNAEKIAGRIIGCLASPPMEDKTRYFSERKNKVARITNIQSHKEIPKVHISAVVDLADVNIEQTLKEISSAGYLNIVIAEKIKKVKEASLGDFAGLDKFEIVVDSIILSSGEAAEKSRILDSVEAALDIASDNIITVRFPGGKEIFSDKNICLECSRELPEISTSSFSFNSPEGACPDCTGLGKKMQAVEELVVPNKNLTIAEGAIRPWRKMGIGDKILKRLADTYGFSLDVPFSQLGKGAVKVLFYGEDIPNGFCGILRDIEQRYRQASSDFLRNEMEEYLIEKDCDKCGGKRLKESSLAVLIGRRNIDDFVNMPIEKITDFLIQSADKFQFSQEEKIISEPIIKEIISKLKILNQLGLGYLALSRTSANLSGGEIQRARLARQLGAELSGILYVLDEPTIGLHQRDVALVINALKQLKNEGNTVLAVEHDKQVMKEADHIIDIGYGAGENGGKVIASGSFESVRKQKTFTGMYLSGNGNINFSRKSCPNKIGYKIIIEKAEENNLKKIDVEIPLGKFVCISGVSGSGKSTLIDNILARALSKKLYNSKDVPGKHKRIKGIEKIKRLVNIDQTPIGRTPRSNPATYTGAFTLIRDIFVNSESAKLKGLKAGHFSFNVKGGRCEYCQGAGERKIEMHFLQDMYVKCEACGGKRYIPEVLEVKHKDLNISDVLSLTISQAYEFFYEEERLREKLELLSEVGLGYLKLGQSAVTLSGGEAQRLKLASELSKRYSEETLYILDEPTTGLHYEDVKKLLKLLFKLVDKGSAVLVVEHNMDVLKNADWIIDLGPEGGEKGGEIIAQGAPADIAKEKRSATGKFLKEIL